MRQYIALFLIIVLFSCKKDHKKVAKNLFENNTIQQQGNTIKTRFSVPLKFKRVVTKPNTFAHYLQNFKLKPIHSKVYLYDGNLKYRQDIHAAILDISVGKRDLQQCADAAIRLRAEFLYAQKRYDDIHFNLTNGFNVAYSKWREGNRLKVNGHKVSWVKTNKESTSDASFQNYLQWVYIYAGTLSLAKEMKPIVIEHMQIGDVFIQGGSPGHAVIVVDMATNEEGKTLFMLAQSYMPAQDIHILKNLNDTANSPWYLATHLAILNSPEWRFTKADLKRFQ